MQARLATRGLLALLTIVLAAPACSRRTSAPREDGSFVPQLKPIRARRVAFAPEDDRRLLILEATGLVGVWDIGDLTQPVRTAWIPGGAIDACFTTDGKALITAGWDGKLRWWSSIGGRLLRTSAGGHRGPARALAAAGDSVVSGGEDGALRVWNADGTPQGEPIAAHEGLIVSVAIAANGDLASAGIDEAIRLWRKDPGSPSGYRARVLHETEGKKLGAFLAQLVRNDVNMGWDHAVAFSPRADALAAASYDGGIRLWKGGDWSTASTLYRPGVHYVRALAWTRGGETLAAGGFGGKVLRWNADGSSRGEVADHAGVVLSVAFSPNGTHFATACGDDRVRLWSASGELLAALPAGGSFRSIAVALAAGGPIFATLDGAGTVRRWRIDGSPAEESPSSSEGRVLSIAFSPDGDKLVGGDDAGMVRLLGSELRKTWQPKIGGFLEALAVGPKGDILAIGSTGGLVEVPLIDRWAKRAPFRACQSMARGLAFSPAEDGLAILCEDGSVKLWSLEGELRSPLLDAGTGAVRGLAISDAGDRLISGGADGSMGFWALPPRRLDESLHIGLPIENVGFHRRGSWVSANGNTVFFFDDARHLVATAVVAPEGVVAFMPDGSFAGSDGVERLARVFRADGTALSVVGTAAHYAPRRLAEALGAS